jgi:hypothetical protein
MELGSRDVLKNEEDSDGNSQKGVMQSVDSTSFFHSYYFVQRFMADKIQLFNRW